MYSPAALISTGVILPLLGVVTVCLRYWVRLRFSPSYIGIDDILIVVGAVFVCGMGAIQIGSTIQGDNSPETKATPAKNYVQYKVRGDMPFHSPLLTYCSTTMLSS